MDIRLLHHVSLPVSDLERSRRFYLEVMGLEEIARPPFDFPGAWFRLGDRELHLIAGEKAVPRGSDVTDPSRLHMAVRVTSFRAAIEHLRGCGYGEEVDQADPRRMVVLRRPVVGYPQLYLRDPDGYLIEVNAEALDD